MDSTQEFPFRFLAIPQELRDYIYGDILTTTYIVDLPQPWVHLSARKHGQIPTSPHRASSRLAILQVSKSVHHEAKHILYRLSTFRFKFPSKSLPIYQDLTKRPAAALMQNIVIQFDMLTNCPQSKGTTLQSTTSTLQFFSGPSIERTVCVVQIYFAISADFLLEASFLDALGKLTTFKTVVVKLQFMDADKETVGRFKPSTYRTLGEYLKVMLGVEEAGKFDEDGCCCLTYHPLERAACKKTVLM